MVRLGIFLILSHVLIATPARAQWLPQPASTGLTSQVTVPFPPPSDPSSHKSPSLAWFLSFLMPGGGQAYNGQWGKSAVFFGSTVVAFALAMSNDEGLLCGADCGSMNAGAVLGMAAWVGSQIDAPISAARINKRTRAEAGALPQASFTIATLHF